MVSELRKSLQPLLAGWLKTESSRLGLTTLLFFISYAILVGYFYYSAVATKKELPKLRRITGLDAVDEAVG
ncbi:MAG: hypothetical protein FWF06_00275, partial [Symbiobacteriaceae bacterium]|nr:hypothetical protein [Symbiobacteriaceae bacterium]